MDDIIKAETDDIADAYLNSRMIAEEVHSPAVKALVKHGLGNVQPGTGTSWLLAGQSVQKPAAPPVAPPDPKIQEWIKKQKSMGRTDEEIEEDLKGIEPDPWTDPLTVATGAGGAVAKLSASAGTKLMPTFFRTLTAAVTAGTAEFPIGAATEKIAESHPRLALPFNLLVGILSGATIENIIEKSVMAGFTRAGLKVAAPGVLKNRTDRVMENLRAGQVPDQETADAIADLNAMIPASVGKNKSKVVSLEDKRLEKFSKELHEDINRRVAESMLKASEWDGWKFNVGDKLFSKKTRKIYTITGRYWELRTDRPMYHFRSPDEAGTFIAERAHQHLTLVEPPREVRLFDPAEKIPLDDFNEIPRYFYHKPPSGKETGAEGIKAYRNRNLDGSTPSIERAFGEKDPQIVWLSRDPGRGKGTLIVDMNKVDLGNIRPTGQAEGNLWHRGDIPREAIVGIVGRDGQAVPFRATEGLKGDFTAFKELASLQRGDPEKAMLAVQRSQISQIYGYELEHVGDLTHRMAQDPGFYGGGYEDVKPKVTRALSHLKEGYGFEREAIEQVEQNLRSEQSRGRLIGVTKEQKLEELKSLSQKYADEHKKLPVYNEAQKHARDAAVALGEWRFDDAIKSLEVLKTHLDKGPDHWRRYALEGAIKKPGPGSPAGSDFPAQMGGTSPRVRNQIQDIDLLEDLQAEKFDPDAIVHVGLKDAHTQGLISDDEASLIDGIMRDWPEAYKEHFEPRWSTQKMEPTEEQLKAHGFKKGEGGDQVLQGVLLTEAAGEMQTDARHLAVLFSGQSDIGTFIHEFGEFAHRRLLTDRDVKNIVNPLWKKAKEKGFTTKDRNEWFSDEFERWWLRGSKRKEAPVDQELVPLFRKVLGTIKGLYRRMRGRADMKLAGLFDDIITGGRDIKSHHIFYSKEQAARYYVLGREATADKLSEQGISGNSKTYFSWDPNTACPKHQAWVNWMQTKIDGGEVDLEDLADVRKIADLYSEAKAAGVDVPCSYCYVEKGRRRALALIAEGKPISAVHQKSMAKHVYEDLPYTNKIQGWSRKKVREVNQRGGLRMFSFSDYDGTEHQRKQIEKLIADCKKKGVSLKAITKNPQFVEDFGESGIGINVSIDFDSLGGEGGMTWAMATALKKKHPENVFVRAVAMNDAEYLYFGQLTRKGLDGWFVDVITPYHHDGDGPLPPNTWNVWHRENGKASEDALKLEEIIKAHPDLRLEERTCCLVGGKCFAEKGVYKNHEKQCACNCGRLAGNLSPWIEDTPAQIGRNKFISGVPESTQKIGPAAESFAKAAPDISERAYAGNINLSKYDQDDIKRIIAGTHDQFPQELQEARRGVHTWDDAEKEASKYTLEDLLGRKLGQALNDTEIKNARSLLVASSENLKTLRDKINAGAATDIDKAEFLKAFNTHYAIEMQVAGAAAEAGRALAMFRQVATTTATTREMLEQLHIGQKNMSPEKIAEMMVGMDSLHQMNTFVKQAKKASSFDMLLEAWINGLLSGPQTHLVNSLSNSLTALWQIPERFTAGVIGRILPGKQSIQEAEALHQIFGMMEGFKDGLKLFGKTIWTGEPSDYMNKIEVLERRAITAENVRSTMAGKLLRKAAPDALEEGGFAARAVDLLGEGVRMPGRFLSAEDEFFRAVGYRMELNALAYRNAAAEGLSGDDMALRIRDIVNNPPESIRLQAVDMARYQTFTRSLGSAGSAFQGFINKVPALKLIVPFIRTPTNILKFGLERTPMAFFSKKILAEIHAGGARRDMALARISLGSVIMGVTAYMAGQGMITGAGPSNPEMKKLLYDQGWQPYSIKIGDKYYSYSRIEPTGMLLGLAADTAEIMGQIGDKEGEQLAIAAVMAISKNITSKTWLRGVSELVRTMDDPDRYGERYLANYVKSFVPGIAAQAERVMDPEMRACYSFIDEFKSRIPGFSDNLFPRRNFWAEPIVLGAGEVMDFFNPIYTSKVKDSPISAELYRLEMPLPMPKHVQSFNGVGIELKPEEYDKFMVLMNKVPLDSTGKALKASLNSLIKDPEYRKASEGYKKSQIRLKVEEAKDLAKRKLLEEVPTLQTLVEYGQQQKYLEADQAARSPAGQIQAPQF